MANNFKNVQTVGVSTTATAVYSGTAGVQATVIGLNVANTGSGVEYVHVLVNSAYMVKNAPLPLGSTLVVVGGDQKLVVGPSDVVKVQTVGGTVDVVVSVLEVS